MGALQVKAGVAYLFKASTGQMKLTMDQIAQFLYTTEGLDKQDVGDFLGSDREKFMTIHDFNQLRAAYLKLFDFTGMTFDEGLRYVHSPSASSSLSVDLCQQRHPSGACRDSMNYCCSSVMYLSGQVFFGQMQLSIAWGKSKN
jgi:hypothetical protein